ncbi:helix-turn-helix domain-containing protein, partial [Acidovorax sp. CCYZU-2555]|uniref:helix-turn-helix domain-containing protein n=1 Tax=Acidovorax sp. CCYZU-2555 TaxID=2835042 RepID=UPI0024BE0064
VTTQDLWPHGIEALPPALQAASGALQVDASEGSGLRAAVEAFERRSIEQSLARHQGNWAAAARALQMDRANLQRLAKRLGCTLP